MKKQEQYSGGSGMVWLKGNSVWLCCRAAVFLKEFCSTALLCQHHHNLKPCHTYKTVPTTLGANYTVHEKVRERTRLEIRSSLVIISKK